MFESKNPFWCYKSDPFVLTFNDMMSYFKKINKNSMDT